MCEPALLPHFAPTELVIIGLAYGYKHLAPLERKAIGCCTSKLNPPTLKPGAIEKPSVKSSIKSSFVNEYPR